MQERTIDVLLLPTVFEFLNFDDLRSYQYLCKRVRTIIHGNDDGGYWHMLCKSFARKFGLYHQCYWMNPFEAKQHMMHDLYQSINKWANVSDQVAQNFKVKTVCRFRPGQSSSGKVLLPLHQFLKLRRDKLKNGGDADDSTNDPLQKFGKQVPEQYIDPIIGTIMRNPVLLGPSQRVVDRSVAVQCIVHGSKDPFTNERLQSSDLQPLPELQSEIEAWAKENLDYDPSINISDLQSLVEQGNEVDPRLLDALLDVQQLTTHSDNLYLATKHNNVGHIHKYEATTFPITGADNGDVEDPATEAIAAAATVENTGMNLMTINVTNTDNTVNNSEALADHVPNRLKSKASDVAKVVDVNPQNAYISMHVPGKGISSFHYAKVFHEKGRNDDQASVYDSAVRDSILSVMNGYNACVLGYGQTGSGKTYTLCGDVNSLDKFASYYENKGHLMTMEEILHHINSSKNAVVHKSHSYFNDYSCPSDKQYERCFPTSSGVTIRSLMELLYAKETLQKQQGIAVDLSAQFVEIYNEKATDLFTGKSILIRRDNGEPVGASTVPLNTVGDAIYVLQQARSRQRFASTEMNERSSRSHTAFIITVAQTANHPIHLKNEQLTVNNDEKNCTSKLYLVDLAGSERLKKSKATGVRLQEAVGINASLLTIGKVISALVEGRPHVPYLESKLTTLLRNSFGGNCKTTVFINCRPDEIHADETLQSMRFGERCSMVLNETKHAATSKTTALETIDKAIERVTHQLQVLKSHGKENKDTYHQLLTAHNSLVSKRKNIELLA
jgi:hypothetical protein